MHRFQVRVHAKLFLDALNSVVQSVRDHSPLLVNRHVMLSFEGNRLILSANDGERGARRVVYLPDPVQEPFQLLLPARFLRELVSRIPASSTLELAVKQPNDPTVTLLVKESRSRFTISQYLGNDYYDLVQATQEQTPQQQLVFFTEPLLKLLQLMLPCAYKDEQRVSLMGVRVEYFAQEKKVRCVATDTHRMLVYETEDVLAEAPNSTGVLYFFPPTLQQLKSYMRTVELKTVYVQVYPERLLLRDLYDEVVFVQVLPANIQFPNYQRILDAELDRCVSLNRQQLLECLNRLSVYGFKTIFHFKDHTLELSVYGDLGMGVETLDLLEPVENFMVAFNLTYLQETLSQLHVDQIEMHFLSSSNMKPVQFTAKGCTWTFVVMPMML